MSDRTPESEQRVTPLELFFDLVFVFAITQVTGYLADHPTWIGLPGILAVACVTVAALGVTISDRRDSGTIVP